MTPDRRSVARLVAIYLAAWRAMDVEALASLFTPDTRCFDPVDRHPIRGRDGVRDSLWTLATTYDLIERRSRYLITRGRHAALHWTGHARGPEGAETPIEGIDVFELTGEGKIQTLWSYWDPERLVAPGA